jgi:hypothetical protein
MMTQLLSRSLGAALLAGVSCSATPTHAADLVLQWNEIAQRAVGPANAYIQSRSMAITHLAIFDAVTGATGTGTVGIGACPGRGPRCYCSLFEGHAELLDRWLPVWGLLFV